MPSVDPRGPLHLLDSGYESAVSPCNNSLDSDSDISETSTFTNSPVSCYSIPKPSNNTASGEPSNPSPETGTTIGTLDQAKISRSSSSNNNKKNDASSISSTDSDSSNETDASSSSSSSCCEEVASDVACATAKMEEDTLNSSAKLKKSVGFTPMSTLYVFDEDNYDVNKTWFSSHELRAFRADAFLTVNWMVMKNMDPQEKELVVEELQTDGNHGKNTDSNNNDPSYTYYSNKYGYDRQKEIQSIAEDAKYEFCERGVECRTPVGRYKKNKRRMDAMRVVLLYQHMQRQHRRERKREERRKEQLQYRQEGKPKTILRNHTSSFEARRRIEADVDADALSTVYGTYCQGSASLALAQGQADAIAAGMPPTPISTLEESQSLKEEGQAEQKKETDKNNPLLKCPSLCDDGNEENDDDGEDEFMDKLISLSFVSQDSDADDEDSENDSMDDHSLSLDDLALDSDDVMEPEEVSGVVEVELIEDEEKQQHSHRISYEEFSPKPRNLRRKSWSSSNSLPNAGALVQHKANRLDAPATSVSFSSLELGDLFLGAVGLNFC